MSENINNCMESPLSLVFDAIGGKWKVVILHQLRGKTLRFGELRKRLPGVSQKILTQKLRDLERDCLVRRKVYAEVPPKVEYSETSSGIELNEILEELRVWGECYKNPLLKGRRF
jgi:DNA-binding HxlR family transcriptional regulator